MPARNVVQLSSWVKPELKRQIEQKIKRNGARVSMSAYIENLIRKDLERKGSAA